MGKIKFSYDHYPVLNEKDELKFSKSTICTIEYKDMLLRGEAICSLRDIFSKRKGRKIALARAIENLNRKERTGIWESYKEKHKL